MKTDENCLRIVLYEGMKQLAKKNHDLSEYLYPLSPDYKSVEDLEQHVEAMQKVLDIMKDCFKVYRETGVKE